MSLTKILSAAVRIINAENEITLKKIAEFGDADKGAGVYRDKDYSEYRVVYIADGEHLNKADYHTSDKQEALDTAELFARPATLGEAQMHTPEEKPAIARPRPRGYNAKPSGLLAALLNRA